MTRRFFQLPPVVPTPLEQGGYSWFSVIVPIARTNLVTNPSVETNTTGYSAGAGTLTRTTEQQYHGAYSLKYVPAAAVDDFFFYGTVSLTSGTLYAISCKFLGASGVKYRIQLTDNTGATALVTYFFTGTGRWQWVWMYWLETSTTTRRIYFAKNLMAGNTQAFYVDGVQCEALANAGETVSTYIDGDQTGLVPNQQPPAYLWTGTPHASTSSRSGLTRAGGQVVPLNAYSFLLASIIGLGVATPFNARTDYARIDGAFDDFTRKPTRQFTLLGRLSGLSSDAVDAFRSDLGAVVDRDRSALDQRLMLRYQKLDACGVPRSNAAQIPCKYLSGLEGNTDNHFQQDIPLSFEQYLPLVAAEGEAGASLTVQASVANANYLLQRSPSGVWSAPASGAWAGVTNPPHAIAYGLDGALYIGGVFTQVSGVAAANIAKRDPITGVWSQVGLGTNGQVRSLAVGPDGRVYLGGYFTQNGNLTLTLNNLGVYDPATNIISAMGTGTGGSNFVEALAFGPDGKLYIAGFFAALGGVGSTADIGYWDGTYHAMGTGGAGGATGAFALAVGPDGSVYVGGEQGTTYGGGGGGLGKWTAGAATPAWVNIGALNAGGSVFAITVDRAGLVYFGGNFTSIGSVSISFIARYNGVTYSALGSGLNGQVNNLVADPASILYASGNFTTAGGFTVNKMARWLGSAWAPLDVIPTGAPNLQGIAVAPDGTLTISYNAAGTTTATAITTVNNAGTGRSYPTFKIYGPTSGTSRIYQILNTATGRSIYLNLTLSVGEVVTMTFQPDNLSFVSTFQGNTANKILPGSNEADFFLQPGANSISFFSADSSVVAALQWRPSLASLDGLTR